jgi:predicted alpha/beta hydrolase family esterase
MDANKTILIVHGWMGNSNRDWMRWLGAQLRERGFRVIVADMPFANAPIPFLWVLYLKRIVGTIDKNTFFVGHSIGCQAIMRMLANQDQECGGAIFVAGWFLIKDFSKVRSEFFPNENFGTKLYTMAAQAVIARWESPFGYENLKKVLPRSIAILSNTDRIVDEKINAKLFQENLGSEIISIANGGHFTAREGFKEFPRLLDEVLKMVK